MKITILLKLAKLSSLVFFLFNLYTSPLESQSIDSTTQIYITEIMYDPASSNTTVWEYVEIYNADSVAYDLTGCILDDAAGAILDEPNIAQGMIAPFSTAVFYNDDNSLANLQTAWDSTVNFIPVSHWGILNNGGDRVGLWTNVEAYNNRDYSHAVTDVFYDGGGEWPVHNGLGSIELNCEDLTICDLYNGQNWHLNNGATFSQAAGENTAVNHGSPGIFPNPLPLVFANRFEFLPAPLDTGSVGILFGIRVCATDGESIQMDYDKTIVLVDSLSTADYDLVSAAVLSPANGCVNFMISPTSPGKIKLDIGNKDFTNLEATIIIEGEVNSLLELEPLAFSVYPTLVNELMQIVFDEKIKESTRIQVFDIRGQLVFWAELKARTIQSQINVSDLPNGFYFVTVGDGVERFIKM